MAAEIQPIPILDDPNATFAAHITGPRELVVLEEGSCTYRAGERFAQVAFDEPPTLVEAGNFTEAIQLAKSAGRILLLPHLASRAVANVTYSDKWEDLTQFTFRYANPPLYLARTASQGALSPEAEGICAALDNLRLLVEPEKEGINDWLWVGSTQEAARICAEGQAELCITNEHGREKHDLTPVRGLKKMTPVWLSYEWIPAIPDGSATIA